MAVQRSHRGISPSWVVILLATVLIVGCASEADQDHVLERTRLLQDENAPVTVGVGFAPASGGLLASTSSTSTAVEDELVEALEKDDQVTGRYRYLNVTQL